MKSQQFDKISQNIQVTLLSPPELAPSAFNKKLLGEERGNIEAIREMIKAGGTVEKGENPDDEAIAKWLEQAIQSTQPDDALFFGSAVQNNSYIFTFWLGKSEPFLKYGFSSGKIAASAMVSYPVTDRMVTIFFNQLCNNLEDVHATKARVKEYMKHHAESISVVPAGENPLLEDIINKAIE